MDVTGFNHVTIRVANLVRSRDFYTGVLGMRLVHEGRTDVYLEWGTAWVCLIERQSPEGVATAGVDHVAFTIADEHFDAAVETLRASGVEIVRGPVARGLGRSVNFLDPDGTELELHTGDLAGRMRVWS